MAFHRVLDVVADCKPRRRHGHQPPLRLPRHVPQQPESVNQRARRPWRREVLRVVRARQWVWHLRQSEIEHEKLFREPARLP